MNKPATRVSLRYGLEGTDQNLAKKLDTRVIVRDGD